MVKKTMDGSNAAAYIAYAFSEVCAIYPITPSSTMGELIDQWASEGKKNIFDSSVSVVEMQSEAGAAGALHGSLAGGVFCSTFTASQGLLLMIPDMYKIAGELMPCVFHVSSRAIARHALSIFGDHQDVMAVRPTGVLMLCSCNVQEVMDISLIAHLSTLKTSIPFLHFFDGFRTSNEIKKIEEIPYEDIKKLIDKEDIERHRQRALNPNHPNLRGTAQNPDVYFQGLEASNIFYERAIPIIEKEMEKVSLLTGRKYKFFDYFGDKDAEKIIVIMGSGADTAEEVVEYLNKKGEKVGVIKVRLFRPFSKKHFLDVIPKSVKKIAVLDKTKEEPAPLYLDVCNIFKDKKDIRIVSGIYGIGQKEFTPNMILSIFDNLDKKEVKDNFTVGIEDDVTFRSLKIEKDIETEDKNIIRCKFWGLGGDGTVGANKEAIKIIGDHTNKYVQGYFAFDSKKSFGLTVSHLRFGDKPIKSSYLITRTDYLASHHPSYVYKYDLLKDVKDNSIFVLNSPWKLEELEEKLPNNIKRDIAKKNLSFYLIDAFSLSEKVGMGSIINLIMQTVFFKLINIIPFKDALKYLEESIEKKYRKKGEEIVLKNKQTLKLSLEWLKKVDYPSSWKELKIEEKEEEKKPDFIKNFADVINRNEGDSLPVSAFTPGGIFPLDTVKYEKRAFAINLPKWVKERCIQCGLCAFVCPHAVIRTILLNKEEVEKAPEGYEYIKAVGPGMENMFFSVQVSSLDCTGCGNCVEICPAKGKALEMRLFKELYKKEYRDFEYSRSLPTKEILNKYTVKGSQLRKPLLEFSGACAGCGETPYLKVLTQLFGDRMVIANATGCSSIWGASCPSIPWSVDDKGRGPAWANSLFEDNAEFGLGIFLAVEKRREYLKNNVEELLNKNIEQELKSLLQEWLDNFYLGDKTRELSDKITFYLEKNKKETFLKKVYSQRDLFVKPSIWIVGGDGWAYDIGFGGLDHVLSLNKDVNILVLDTEVYSNTGGQASKATPLGSVAKFASAGKRTMKKDLGMLAMTYKNVYVASVALGADQNQVIRAFKEAESYRGPSLIIAYSSCISHGIKEGMRKSHEEEKKAVEMGYWINYRYDPRKEEKKMVVDSKKPTFEIEKYLDGQVRYEYLKRKDPETANKLREDLKRYLKERYKELIEKQ